MRSGSVASLAKVPEHRIGQAWSRFFYEDARFGGIDGLIYRNAHNDEDAVALYERASPFLECTSSSIIRLDHPALRPEILRIAEENNILVAK